MSDKSGQVMEAPKGLWHPNHLQPSSWYHSHKLAVGAWWLIGWLNQTHPILDKGYLRQMTEFHIMKPPKFRGCFKTKWLKPPPGMFFMQGMARNQTPSPYTQSQPFGLSGSCHLGFDFAMAAAMCKETLQGTFFFRTKIGMWTFRNFSIIWGFHNFQCQPSTMLLMEYLWFDLERTKDPIECLLPKESYSFGEHGLFLLSLISSHFRRSLQNYRINWTHVLSYSHLFLQVERAMTHLLYAQLYKSKLLTI